MRIKKINELISVGKKHFRLFIKISIFSNFLITFWYHYYADANAVLDIFKIYDIFDIFVKVVIVCIYIL